jgi:hypothetical protein
MGDGWLAWWRGDGLSERDRLPQQIDEKTEIAWNISHVLQHIRTQKEFAEALRTFKNPITDIFAHMLKPQGTEGWKLVLKRSSRGNPPADPAAYGLYTHYYGQIIEEHGERGAIKRLAKELKMTPDWPEARTDVHVIRDTPATSARGGTGQSQARDRGKQK